MKSKVTVLIAAFAILVSFAFITVNKEAKTNSEVNIEKLSEEPITPYALEDENQWD